MISSLHSKASRTLVEWRGLPSNSTWVLEAEPGKLDIKRREPGILFISLQVGKKVRYTDNISNALANVTAKNRVIMTRKCDMSNGVVDCQVRLASCNVLRDAVWKNKGEWNKRSKFIINISIKLE